MLSICQKKCWEECYYGHIYMEMVDVKSLNSEMAFSRDHDSYFFIDYDILLHVKLRLGPGIILNEDSFYQLSYMAWDKI